MKNLTRWVLVVLLGLVSLGSAAGTMPQADEDAKGGQLKLIEDNGDSCTIDIVPGIHHYYMGDHGCQNDEYYKFQLLDAKSAIWILFGSENGPGGQCPETPGAGWAQEIKTIKNGFTSDEMSLEHMAGFKKGEIVQPGIIKVFAYDKGDEDYDGRLSCVSIFWCPASAGIEGCRVHDPNHVVDHWTPIGGDTKARP